MPCVGLLGSDILGRFDHILDTAGGTLTISTAELPHGGQSVRLIVMHLTSRLSPIALVLLVLGSCASGQPLAPGSPEEVLRAFVAALNHADDEAIANLLEPDATAFLPFDAAPAELEGREAICGAFAAFFRDLRKDAPGPEYMHLVPKSVHTQRAGDGLAVVTFDAGAGPVVSRRTLVIQRNTAGWRIMHFHGSNVRKSTPGAGA